jgi:hypothetical protein
MKPATRRSSSVAPRFWSWQRLATVLAVQHAKRQAEDRRLAAQRESELQAQRSAETQARERRRRRCASRRRSGRCRGICGGPSRGVRPGDREFEAAGQRLPDEVRTDGKVARWRACARFGRGR